MTDHLSDQQQRDRAIAAYQIDPVTALSALQAARTRLPFDGGLLICEAGALLASEAAQPLANLTAIVQQAPDWHDGQAALARFRFEQGDKDYLDPLEKALAALPPKANLWRLYMQLLADGGQPERAAKAAQDLRNKGAPPDDMMLLEARFAGLAGEWDRAEKLFDKLPAHWPAKALDEARHRLRQADPERAELQLAIAREQAPDSVSAWALTEICWRYADDARHSWLLPELLMPVQIDLELAPDSLQALVAKTRSWHSSQARPLGQSVRAGTQTRGNLFLRAEPEIASLAQQLSVAVQHYHNGWPGADETHPLLRHCKSEITLAAGWSILIRPPGYHVSHVHDGGLISSAFHLAVPDGEDDLADQGALELGRPPQDIALDLPPLQTIAAKPGHLVLFPSFLYHGTRPINRGERLTIAFDAGVVATA